MLSSARCVYLTLAVYAYLAALVRSVRRPSDTVLLARCSSYCHDSHRFDKTCLKECIVTGWKDKPGDCPKDADAHSLACINECSSDKHCHGYDKCCPHACGITCKPPEDLLTLPGLPEIPQNVKVTERKKSDVVVVTWSESSKVGSKTLYLVQERHTPGLVFRVDNLGPWNQPHRSPKSKPRAKLVLKRGNWYQIRVAAVSANGTRGYSQPTHHFILSQSPRCPLPPSFLTFTRTTRRNGSASGLLSWEPPLNSDLPLLKYNVYWSKRAPTSFTQTKKVPGDITSVKIRNLSVASVYDFEVEAVAQYGREKLVSSKATLPLNITDTGISIKRGRGERARQRAMAIQLSKPSFEGGKLNYRLSWKARPSKPYEKYALTWQSDCGQPRTTKNVVTASWQYEMSDLKFSCKYIVLVREKPFGRKSKRSGRMTFTSASCSEFDPPAC